MGTRQETAFKLIKMICQNSETKPEHYQTPLLGILKL